MSPDEWERIKLVFEGALAVDASARAEYLSSACRNDPQISEAVHELLCNHESFSPAASRRTIDPACALAKGDIVAGRFRVVRFIAAGAMGEVYEAFDERLRLRLALKTLKPELMSDEYALERFQREILVARGVAHDSLCKVYDFVEHRDANRLLPCLSMELIEGESLATYLQRERPLPCDQALAIGRQIAAGLDVLHEHGIVHRDLKPSNIMLARRRDGRTRTVVTDFGLAKAAGPDGDLFESYTQIRAGAPFFMAPELLRTGEPSTASDVYAFGLILDEMVTTEKAFPTRSLPELYYAKLWEGPIATSDRSRDLPPNWTQAIARCLHSIPERRFGRAGEVVEALECNAMLPLDSTTVAFSTPIPAPSPPALRPAVISRRVLVGGAAGILGLSAAGILAVGLQGSGTSIEVFDIANHTGQPEFGYVSSGTTNELLRRLTHLRLIRVLPVRSTRENAPPRVSTRFSLEGTLQADSGRVVLAVQLTDNRDGSLVWSERFENPRDGNPLQLQSDIAQQVVAQLDQRFVATEGSWADRYEFLRPLIARLRPAAPFHIAKRLVTNPTQSNTALDLYMRGRQLLEEISLESTQAAIVKFKGALEVDPGFALASASLAEAYLTSMNYNVRPHKDLLANARLNAELAVKSDAGLAEGHAALGAVRQMNWDWEGAEESYIEALRLKPGFARARQWYAGLILQFGRIDQAMDEARKSLELDPHDRATPTTYGFFLLCADRSRDAIQVLERTVEGRDAPGTRRNLGQAYARLAYLSGGSARKEYFGKAFSQAARVQAIERRPAPDGSTVEQRPSLADEMFALFHSMAGDVASAAPHIRRLIQDMDAGMASPVTVAWMHTAQGKYEEAMDLLEYAASFRDRRLLYVKISPFLERLRDLARFRALIQKMRL